MRQNEIIGHKEEMDFLKAIIDKDRVSSSYIFAGPSGIGKKMAALKFAEDLKCDAADLSIIAPSEKRNSLKIESMRELKRKAFLKPYGSPYKVFIIDDAENLTHESQNSILKILEDAPEKTIFILITDSLHKVLPTISSRCRIVRFKPAGYKAVSDFLMGLGGITEEKALFLAKFSKGRIGEAIRVKNEDFIGKKNKSIDKILFITRNPDKYPGMSDWAYSDRDSLKEDLLIYLSWFRDILIFKTSSDNDLVLNIDRRADIVKESGKFQKPELEKLIDKLVLFNRYLDSNVNMKLIVDVLLSELSGLSKGKYLCMK